MRNSLRAFALVLGCALAAAPVSAQGPCLESPLEQLAGAEHGGIGGTGWGGDEDGSGLGGTGRGGDEGGIGGTGHEGPGGTGVYGTIRAFGSICVNGLRLAVGGDTSVTVYGQAATSEALRIGHIVWVRVERGEGALRASRVEAFAAATGVLQAIQLEPRRILVDGRWIRLSDDATIADVREDRSEEGHALALLQIGAPVRVSALRSETSEWVATRVERTARVTPLAAGPREPVALAQRDGIHRLSIEGIAEAGSDGVPTRVGGIGLSGISSDAGVRAGERLWLTTRLEDGSARLEGLSRPAPPPPPRPSTPRPLPRFQRPGIPDPGARTVPPRPSPGTEASPRPSPTQRRPAPPVRVAPRDAAPRSDLRALPR